MWIIKIGGGKTINLKGIIADLAEVKEKFIIVHGANALRDNLAEELKKPKKTLTSVSGFTSVFSDENALDLMMMTYSGLRNKRLVELCQQHGLNAIGMSGIDGRMIVGLRNIGIRVNEGNKLKIVRDLSGKPQTVNTNLLNLLLENDYIPVLTMPILDENNFAINSENDEVVRVLHSEFNVEKIIQLIEAKGLLDNLDDSTSMVKKMNLQELINKQITLEGRMKRKILALAKLLEQAPTTIHISDGRVKHPIQNVLNGEGTIIS